MEDKRRIVVGKIDPDTIGVAFILGVCPDEQIEVIQGQASSADLADPQVICIEVGGSGQTALLNFDHHAEDGPVQSATAQAWHYFVGQADDDTAEAIIAKDQQAEEIFQKRNDAILQQLLGHSEIFFLPEECDFQEIPEVLLSAEDLEQKRTLERDRKSQNKDIRAAAHVFSLGLDTWSNALVTYINTLEIHGPRCLREKIGDTVFPTLYDILSGLLLSVREPVAQLLAGLEILHLAKEQNLNPFGTVPLDCFPHFEDYAKAKAEHRAQLQAGVVEPAKWERTQSGRRLAYVETVRFGALGALYQAGAEIAVVYNPQFGEPPVAKFSIAGDGLRIDAVRAPLNEMEPGWGGPAHGTILSSPKAGSKLTLETVVGTVKKAL